MGVRAGAVKKADPSSQMSVSPRIVFASQLP
jgi:hypothetical protein